MIPQPSQRPACKPGPDEGQGCCQRHHDEPNDTQVYQVAGDKRLWSFRTSVAPGWVQQPSGELGQCLGLKAQVLNYCRKSGEDPKDQQPFTQELAASDDRRQHSLDHQICVINGTGGAAVELGIH